MRQHRPVRQTNTCDLPIQVLIFLFCKSMNKNASVGIPMKKICGRLTRILCTCAVFVSLTGAAYAQSAPVTLDRKKAPVRGDSQRNRTADRLPVRIQQRTGRFQRLGNRARRTRADGAPTYLRGHADPFHARRKTYQSCAGSLKRPRTPPRLRPRNRPSRVR